MYTKQMNSTNNNDQFYMPDYSTHYFPIINIWRPINDLKLNGSVDGMKTLKTPVKIIYIC